MAAFAHRVRFKKSFSQSSPQIIFGPIRNKLISLNEANYCHLRPQARAIYNWNRTLFSSLQANQFLFRQVFPSRLFMKCLQKIPTREKSFSISNFLATKNSRHFFSPFLPQILNNSSLLSPNPICSFEIQSRFKQQKKNRNKKLQEDELSDDEANDLEDEVFEEETDLPLNYKELTIHVKSPRADTLLSMGLNISRAKIDSMFYGKKLLHNEKPLTKKSKNLEKGDCVDLIMEGSETVKRIKVLKISSERGQTDKISIVLRAWRSPFSLESLPEEE